MHHAFRGIDSSIGLSLSFLGPYKRICLSLLVISLTGWSPVFTDKILAVQATDGIVGVTQLELGLERQVT